MKKILNIYSAPRPHWVGNGFPVRSLFSYDGLGQQLSPFLLLDHGGPREFDATTERRGVGVHPHRGFETVTIVYEGEVAHRDSTGEGGLIGPGDVQWMTAAGGILHEEYHSDAFAQRGGTLEIAQLWVNLPAKDKMTAPSYQTLLDATIPSVDLPEGAGRVRVIAGAFQAARGPARTFTPIDLWDLRIAKGHSASFEAKAGHTLALAMLHGTVQINGSQAVREGQLVHLERAGTRVKVEAQTAATLLWLAGEPIEEPVVGYGPFVMNSDAEIGQAIADFNGGRFGSMPS